MTAVEPRRFQKLCECKTTLLSRAQYRNGTMVERTKVANLGSDGFEYAKHIEKDVILPKEHWLRKGFGIDRFSLASKNFNKRKLLGMWDELGNLVTADVSTNGFKHIKEFIKNLR